MGFFSQDGSEHGSRFVARRKDREHEIDKQKHGEADLEKARGLDVEPKDKVQPKSKNMSVEDAVPSPHETVQDHGAAHTITIKHADNDHSVESEHEDGHIRHAKFTDPDEAHEDAKKLAGLDKNEQGLDEHAEAAEEGGDGLDFTDVA
jgi:hypothetical protein